MRTTTLLFTCLAFLSACATSTPEAPLSLPTSAPEVSAPKGPTPEELATWTDFGEPPKLTGEEGAECVIFKEVVVRFGNETQIDTRDRANGCELSPQAVTIELGDAESLKGAVGTLVFFFTHQGSDFHDLDVIDATTGKVVFRREWVSPVAVTRVDPVRGVLVFDGTPEAEGCGEEYPYKAWEASCWPIIQKTWSAFKDVEPPGCDCGPSGLEPYALVRFEIPLDDLSKKLTPTPPVSCGCSS